MKKTTKSTKFITLDILKGIAMTLIIIVHNRHFIVRDMSGLRPLMNFGQMGCQMFFMVSGMALCYSWFKKTDPVKSFPSKTGSFYLKRYLRIAPGFIIMLLVNYLLNVLLIDYMNLSPGFIMKRDPLGILINILLLHGLFPAYNNNVFPGGWYIGTAFLLYILFPFVVSLFEKLNKKSRFLIYPLPFLFWLIAWVVLHKLSEVTNGNFYPYNNSYAYFTVINQLPSFSLGILLYFEEKRGFSKKVPLYVSLPIFIGILGVTLHYYLSPEIDFIFIIFPSLVALSYFWLAVALLHIEHSNYYKILRTLPCRLLAAYGKNSYGVYLIHSLFSWYLIKALTTSLLSNNINYPEMTLYFVLFIPTILLTALFGHIFNIFLDKINIFLMKLNKTL